MEDLQRFRSRRNRFSQNGEDGVIAEICRRLEISNDWFCEFGAWDGRYGSNCYALLLDGWHGVMIEGDPQRYTALQRLAEKHPKLITIGEYVSHDPASDKALDNLLSRTPIPDNFALLSIDIDGFDYHVWESLTRYRPIIVIIEINSSTLPGVERVFNGTALTSFSAMLKLGVSKGYRLAAHTGNMIFVREDYVSALGLPKEALDRPETLFVHDWVNPTRLQTWRRKIRHMTPQRAWVKFENWLRSR